MKFSLEETRKNVKSIGSMDLIEATEGLTDAWMSLSEAQRNMDEVCDVMENIQQSLDLIAKFGNDAIPVLNVDKSLEGLLGIEEKLINADKAQEGLGDALVVAFTKLKEWFIAAINFVRKIIGKIIEFLGYGVTYTSNFLMNLGKIVAGDQKRVATVLVNVDRKESATEVLDAKEFIKLGSDLKKNRTVLDFSTMKSLLDAMNKSAHFANNNVTGFVNKLDSEIRQIEGSHGISRGIGGRYLSEIYKEVERFNSSVRNVFRITVENGTPNAVTGELTFKCDPKSNVKLGDIGWTYDSMKAFGNTYKTVNEKMIEASTNVDKNICECEKIIDSCFEEVRKRHSDNPYELKSTTENLRNIKQSYMITFNVYKCLIKNFKDVDLIIKWHVAHFDKQILAKEIGRFISDALNNGSVSHAKLN